MESMQDRQTHRPPPKPVDTGVIPPAQIAAVAGPAIIGEDRMVLNQFRDDTMHAIDVVEKSLRTGLQVLSELRTAIGGTVRR